MAQTIRAELERTAEEATYLAVGLGVLALKELRRRRRGAPESPSPVDVVSGLAAMAAPVVKEVRSALDGLGRLARDVQGRGRGDRKRPRDI